MRRPWKRTTLALALLLAAGSFGSSPLHAQQACPTCPVGAACHPHHERCPPPFVHWQEGPPRIRYKHACPRPVCNPCDLPHFGYFQPRWRPWPFPPGWSHCPEMPPIATIYPGPLPATAVPVPTEPEPTPIIPAPDGAEKLLPPLPDKLNFGAPGQY